jgi:small subunit ribosomal protein S16
MLTIRLKRIGKKKFPTYRLIISEKTKDTWGSNLEELGSYNPHVAGKKLLAKIDRIKYWIGKGAQMSDTVNNLLVSAGIIEGQKKKAIYLSKKRKAKLEEKVKQKAESEAKKQAEKVADVEPVEVPAENSPTEEPLVETASAEPAVEAVPELAPESTPENTAVPVVEEQKDGSSGAENA